MPWNEMTGQFENTSAPATPSSNTPLPPYAPGGGIGPGLPERNPLNDSVGKLKILRYEDIPVMDANDKPVPGEFIRKLHLEDGTVKSYEYNAQDDPENWAGRGKDYIPAGAKYLGDSEDTAAATLFLQREALRVSKERAGVQDQQQNATQAGNAANQTGFVMVPGPDGNPIQQLGPDGQPIPTLAREQFNRQTGAQEASTSVQREQNAIARERGAAQDLYNQATLAATKERDRLNALVSAGTLQANAAKERFDEWMKLNVEIPFKQMEEARARATEARLAQQAEDKRRQDAALYQQEREKTALGVGTDVMKANVATLPYMAGPNWGSQFGNALNAVARGRPQDIHFDSSGLNFQSPDFQKIAEDATARALAHLSPYAAAIAGAGDRPGGGYVQTDYSQVPNVPSGAGAPQGYDPSGLVQQLGGYSPPTSAPIAPQPPQTGPVDQWR